MDMLLVKWSDVTSSPSTWLGREEAEALQPTPMLTIGWLVLETEDYMVLAGTKDPDGDTFGDVNCIPVSLIESAAAISPTDYPS